VEGLFAMSEFVVSARKYRPSTFSSVIGQPVITATLKSAIARNQLAHAYLFCGPRGVGKTTCARIFAKTINCTSLTKDVEACNECSSCQSFNSGRSLNIHELDAASNNSVDDIRGLIDQVQIAPMDSRYKVFIIDEVHMLSQAAFNAFLKTLEEPPSYAIFILATTEKHKILPTILSRCQVFDFNRIRVDDTINFLKDIAAKEQVTFDDESLNVIAAKADGAMRDALSIFDQVVSYSEGKIEYQKTMEVLNLLDVNYYFRLTEAIVVGDYGVALQIFDEVVTRGFDMGQFLDGFQMHLRNLLLASDLQTAKMLDVGETFANMYRRHSASTDLTLLMRALMVTTDAQANFRTSANGRLHIEVLLITLCKLKADLKKNG
jgi:DNA polymerase III, subunit gamma and tau